MNKKENKINIKGKNAVLIIENNIYGTCEVLIDIDDIERVKQQSWYIRSDKNKLYALSSYAKKNGYRGYLHRFITDCPADKVVDHRNGNTLDNRKCNLRICTHLDNMKNTGMRTDNKSGYRYIYYNKLRKAWEIKIKSKRVGAFKNLEDAYKARNEYLLANYPEEVWLRFDRA